MLHRLRRAGRIFAAWRKRRHDERLARNARRHEYVPFLIGSLESTPPTDHSNATIRHAPRAGRPSTTKQGSTRGYVETRRRAPRTLR